MIQNGPKMTQNYPKWPKNDARIYALFPQFFFLTEKAIPQTFSLLECMVYTTLLMVGNESILPKLSIFNRHGKGHICGDLNEDASIDTGKPIIMFYLPFSVNLLSEIYKENRPTHSERRCINWYGKADDHVLPGETAAQLGTREASTTQVG